jgi:Lon-like ATP-dependent protease
MKALELVTKEKELAKLQRDINKQVEEKMAKSQREYFLREQLKSIKKELGVEKDDKDDMMARFAESIAAMEARHVDAKVVKAVKDEMQKLGTLERNSPEFNVTRSYLEWLVAVPWNVLNKDRLDLAAARHTLDAEHYGLDDVKKRILVFIAVGKLRGTVAGKIVCLIGPPGVGKTSIAKSIATALNRSFYRFSVGGLTDVAEIKGHRRTYIGAMPGKPIQSLKTTGCANPLILIDEIDKLGRGYNGDPASALLELLDPNQNTSFMDHYLDVPADFSNVLFVCTANDESTIPGPLKDRMEVIRLSGYDIPEKVSIARTYLVPKVSKCAAAATAACTRRWPRTQLTHSLLPVRPTAQAMADAGVQGVPGFVATIEDDALEALVRNYCRESGVRSLEKHIDKIARKIAYNAVEKQEKAAAAAVEPERVTVTAANLEEFVGKPKHSQDTIYDSGSQPLPVGVVMGLAWVRRGRLEGCAHCAPT